MRIFLLASLLAAPLLMTPVIPSSGLAHAEDMPVRTRPQLTPEQREAKRAEMKAKWENATPEQKAEWKGKREAKRAEMKAKWENATPEQKAEWKAKRQERMANATPEQKAKMEARKAEMKAKFEALSPEEKQKFLSEHPRFAEKHAKKHGQNATTSGE